MCELSRAHRLVLVGDVAVATNEDNRILLDAQRDPRAHAGLLLLDGAPIGTVLDVDPLTVQRSHAVYPAFRGSLIVHWAGASTEGYRPAATRGAR
jgi:hypothetical protein